MSILEEIYKAGLAFLSPLSDEETYAAIVKEAAKLVNGEHGSIHLADNGSLKRVYATDPSFYKIKIRKNGIRYKAYLTQTPIVLHGSVLKQLEKRHPELKGMAGRSVILIPLSYQKHSMGLLSVISRKDKYFHKKELEILKLFGSMASLAVRKAQLYSETKNALYTRDLFISLAAHELRTPLTTINGYVQLILTKMHKKKPIQNEWILELGLESQRLKSLINEFLEINSIRTGKLQYDWKEISVGDVAQRAMGTFEFNNHGRKLEYEDKLDSKSGRIIGDPDKLLQVFINILENAGKYSPDNKKIFITLKYESPFYIFEIKDEGKGIASQDLPLIFKGFYKGRDSVHEGMGLGLYLAKNIIESHHGEIDIKSDIGKGTTVRIKLPKIEE